MASVASLTTGQSGADQTSYTTGSITPTAGRPVLLAVAANKLPTISGAGLTWTLLGSATDIVGDYRLAMFVGVGTPSAGALTIDFGVQTQAFCMWSIFELVGPDPSTGIFKQFGFNRSTGTTALTVTLGTMASSGTITVGAFFRLLNQATTPGAGFTELADIGGAEGVQLQTEWVNAADQTVDASWLSSALTVGIAVELYDAQLGQAALQGVATLTPDAHLLGLGDAPLQSVATVAPAAQLVAGGLTTLQGIGRVSAEAQGVPRLDFTVYDAYLEANGEIRGLLFFDEQKPETVSRKLEPTRQDVGNNPDEIRPDFGNFFAQSDFSHGAGQHYFHQPGRDAKKYWYSEGFDISDPGRLTHLHAIAEAHNSANVGAIAQAGDLPFVVDGQGVRAGNGAFAGTWTNEDPSGADADQNVNDLIAEGARLFAAINTATGSVRVRSSGGTWTRHQVSGTDLSVGIATHLAWVKSRLMVIGGTNSRSIYEVAASATPTAIETLPEGWSFENIFEAGGFIHACAVNPAAGLSRVHHYGLNAAGSAIEIKSSTPWPQGQIMYVGCGFPGLAFIAGGKRTSAGGYDPILYRAQVGELGEMQYIEVREEEGSGSADLSCRALISEGETILAGWSLGSAAYGGSRDGLAVYHIARDAFALHLRRTGGGANQRIASIMSYKGRILLSITGDGLYYEDLAAYVPTATLDTSLADWNNAGLKVWDFVEIAHDPLVANVSVAVAYDTVTFELATWNDLLNSNVDGEEGATGRLANVKSRMFALRITSTATASASPVFLGYSVRSLPAPTRAEFQLTRYLRLLDKDRKDEDASVISQDPRELLFWLQDAIYSFITFYESGANWSAWLEDASTVEPEQPFYETTGGEALKDAFVVRLQMTGTR